MQMQHLGPYFGLHLLIDSFGSPDWIIWSKDLVKSFLRNSIEIAEMTLIHGPEVFEYRSKNLVDSGVSGEAILAESHVTVHTTERHGFITSDLYSCNTFDESEIITLFEQTFQPESVQWKLIKRGEGFWK